MTVVGQEQRFLKINNNNNCYFHKKKKKKLTFTIFVDIDTVLIGKGRKEEIEEIQIQEENSLFLV